jgi:hypothetical protein
MVGTAVSVNSFTVNIVFSTAKTETEVNITFNLLPDRFVSTHVVISGNRGRKFLGLSTWSRICVTRNTGGDR